MSRFSAAFFCASCAAWLVALPAVTRADEESPQPQPPAEDQSSSDSAPSNAGLHDALQQEDLSIHHAKKKKPAPPARTTTSAAPVVTIDGETPPDTTPVDATKHIQLFLIPIGEDTAPLLTPTQTALEGEVNEVRGYEPLDLVEALEPPPSPDVVAKMTEARHSLQDGNQLLQSQQFTEATGRYQHAVDLFTATAGFIHPNELADAMVRLAIGLQYSGEDDQARKAFRTAALYDQAHKVNGKTIDPDLGAGLEGARRELARSPVGTLSIITAPPGSRVFIGGAYRGTTPLTVDHIPVGINYVQIDRPGAQRYVRLVEVKEGQDIPVKARMSFTDETVDLQKMLTAVPAAINRDKSIPDEVRGLTSRFRLDRIVIATVRRQSNDLAQVRLAVFDMHRDARIADEHALFHTDPDQLRDEVARWAKGVLARADGTRQTSGNSLDRTSGTEDWYAGNQKKSSSAPPPEPAAATPPPTAAPADEPGADADQPQPRPAKKEKKKKKKDEETKSLDRTTGTEDWDDDKDK
jgi:hypothetical protein